MARFYYLGASLITQCLFTTVIDNLVWKVSVIQASQMDELKEYCQYETFEANCRTDEVIVIKKALWGRVKDSRCVKRDYGYVGCYTDVRHLADRRCSGKQKCRISVPDQLFSSTVVPCPEDFKLFLAIAYKCVKVINGKSGQCQTSNTDSTDASITSGLIPSSSSSTCGTPQNPWIIRVHSGQRINLTLVDFTSPSPSTQNHSRYDVTKASSGACQVLAVVKEANPLRTVTVCGGMATNEQRERHLYLSNANVIEIRTMVTSKPKEDAVDQDQGQYLLRYIAVGCANAEPPPNGWWRREGLDRAAMGCDNSEHIFTLTCHEHAWSRDTIVNCTHMGVSANVQTLTSLSQANALVTVVGIAVIVGLAMMTVGLCIIKRRRINWCKSHSSTAHTTDIRSQHIPETNYFTSPTGRLPDYFSVTGLPPYSGSIPRKDSYSGGSDGNDYAYVEDFASVATCSNNAHGSCPAKTINAAPPSSTDNNSTQVNNRQIMKPDSMGQIKIPVTSQMMIRPAVKPQVCARMTSCPSTDNVQFRGPGVGPVGPGVGRPGQQYFIADSSSQYGSLQ